MDIISYLVHHKPGLKKKLHMAHIKKSPEEYMKQIVSASFLYSALFGVIAFFFVGKQPWNPIFILLTVVAVFILSLPLCYAYISLGLDAEIKKREGDINKEVIFAGRFLLVKLESGMPIFNALIEGSKSYGVSAKYFKEIVDDINVGTPIEEALDNAMEFTPSDKFRKILFHINNALKLGIDVSSSLRSVIDELVSQEKSEIKAYSKKLSSVAMFYMLGAIVLPSLGMTMFVVVLSFLSINLPPIVYAFICMLIGLLQFFFITVFRGIRPNVNL